MTRTVLWNQKIIPAQPALAPAASGINQVEKVDEGWSKSCHPSVRPSDRAPPNLGRGAPEMNRKFGRLIVFLMLFPRFLSKSQSKENERLSVDHTVKDDLDMHSNSVFGACCALLVLTFAPQCSLNNGRTHIRHQVLEAHKVPSKFSVLGSHTANLGLTFIKDPE